ncbi:hypothetical protein DCAR_0205556 [Daucus carota subsp. sativus]|uniref:Zinc finger PHD-type domain-containing protein n=1 Tax=Daucus carota subsp. sativus TaxID=79200 RepID=A0AAF1AKU0_DAUCS|nr:hypothetical protein DCAR_0205556 [Daucus carota subsp. sativus]
MIASDITGRVHDHQLIKKEDYHAREGDLCYGCGLLLDKSSSVYHCTHLGTNDEEYNCAKFFLHKACAHLPTMLKHPNHHHRLTLSHRQLFFKDKCNVCGIKLTGFTYYCRSCKDEFQICVACVIPIKTIEIRPPYHPHKLSFLANGQATFRCDACHEVDTDFSYMCNTCSFWIHLKCSNLARSLVSDIYHKHPLRLAYSLPEIYRRFQQSCRICNEVLQDPSDWIYYCQDCRFFAHIKCATSPPPYYFDIVYTSQEDSVHKSLSDLVHLPLPDDESLLRHCIQKGSFSWWKDAALTPPDHINHWSHQHPLSLKNPSVVGTTSEEEILPICNGCTESITIKDGPFYECGECEYILHGYCAHFPKEMSDPGLGRKHVAIQLNVHDIWSCNRCKCFRNGIQMRGRYETSWGKISTVDTNLDSGCAVLPKMITHKAHQHKTRPYGFGLEHCFIESFFTCSACGQYIKQFDASYMCEADRCLTYLHTECALKPLRVTHRWDPHPLHLTTSLEEVTDHPHEFHCEFCSEEIDTNYWFYHCSVCDLHKHELKLSERPLSSPISRDKCDVCGITLKWFTYYCDFYKCEFQICLACIIPFNKITIHPPYHPHKLTFLANLATFRCDGCHEVDTDFSYMCYTCPFWIHLKCSNLPPLLACDIHHKHPLRLTYSLPENYRRFQQSCRICRQYLQEIDTNYWFYHCSVCDLSFHLKGCMDLFLYSKVKFGATNIKLDAHHHGLTFVLNKKKRQPCHRCHKDTFRKPVLQCAPCKFVQHAQPELCS